MATKPPRITGRAQQPVTRPIIPNPARYTGRVAGNQFVGKGQWDPRGFWAIPNYGKPGQTLHIRPDGTKLLVKPGAGGAAAAAATAGAAPGAASPYNLSNLPPDAAYDAAIAAAQRARDTTITGIAGERARGLSDYGFNEGPNGALAYDPNNPFSKASVLKKAYDTNRRSSAQSMGAGGQLTGGAFQNSQDLINRNQLQGEDEQQKLLINFLAGNTQQTRDAGTAYETTAAGAASDRIDRFSSNPLYDPATLQSTPTTAAAAAPPKASPAAGRPTKTTAHGRFYQRASDKKWIPY